MRRHSALPRFQSRLQVVLSLLLLFAFVGVAMAARAPRWLQAPSVEAVTATHTTATLTWSPARGATGYATYLDGAMVTADTTSTSETFQGLQCGRTYRVGVSAHRSPGSETSVSEASATTDSCADTAPPSAPPGATVSGIGPAGATVAWQAASDDVAVTGYTVVLGAKTVADTAATTQALSGLACGTHYNGNVTAVDAAGNRSSSAPFSFTTSACVTGSGGTGTTPTTTSPTTTTPTTTTPTPTTTTPTTTTPTTTPTTTTPTTTSTTTTPTTTSTTSTTTTPTTTSTTTTPTSTTPTAGATPPAGTPTMFVTPSGSDGNPCTQAAPCKSLTGAYAKAKPGAVVSVAAGTYGSQVVQSRGDLRNLSPGCTPTTPANCVRFVGSGVKIDGVLEVHGSSVWIDGGSFAGIPQRGRTYGFDVKGYADTEADSASAYPDHVVMTGIHATSFGVFNTDTAYLGSMDVGPATVSTGCGILQGPGMENKIGFGGGITKVPTNITLDRMIIHNQNGDAGRIASDCHFGGLFLVTANGLTIKNSVFSQNVVYNIQVQNFGGAPVPTNVTIENNWFGCPVEWKYVSETTCDGQADIQFNAASPFANWLVRYNSLAGGIGQYVGGASYQNVRVAGNAGARGPCLAGVTYSYNAWDKTGCAPTDKSLGGLPFKNAAPGQEDFATSATAGSVNMVTPTTSDYAVASDIAGTARPAGAARDAGASEMG